MGNETAMGTMHKKKIIKTYWKDFERSENVTEKNTGKRREWKRLVERGMQDHAVTESINGHTWKREQYVDYCCTTFRNSNSSVLSDVFCLRETILL